jgi:hypothetical protein
MQAEPPYERGGIALGLENLDLTLQFLMTRYAHRPEPAVAQAVADHLAMLLRHPLVAEQLEYRAFYQQQLSSWQRLADANSEEASPKHVRQERDRWRDRALQAESRQQQLADQLAGWQQGQRAEELRRRIRWLENQLVRQKMRAKRAEQRAAEAAEGHAPEPAPPDRRSRVDQPPGRKESASVRALSRALPVSESPT